MEELVDVTEPVCEMAGSYIPCEGPVRYVVDPFDEDIYGIITMRWLCERHEYESAMDI